MSTTGVPDSLAAAIDVRLIRMGDPDWDDARQVFDLTVDLRPAAIAVPESAVQVAAIVDLARESGLGVAVRSSGHGAGAHSGLDDAIILDVSRLDEIEIDADARRVRVGAGVRWHQLAPRLSDLGLAALHGSSPLVGISGYSLGGGIGWLGRRHGLQANAVTAIELVTADGVARRVDADNEPELFWALRGGGGNFGVVTAIEFVVHAVPELYAGAMFFPLERSAEVLHTWRDLLATLPEELTTWASLLRFPDVPEVPPPVRGRAFVIIMGAFLGGEQDGAALLEPVRSLGPEMDTFAAAAPEALGELAMDPPQPMPFATAHAILDDFLPEAVDALLMAAGPDADVTPALAIVQLRHIGGALARPAPGGGARASLPGEICVFAAGVVMGEEAGQALRRALGSIQEALAPWRGTDYLNFVDRPADAGDFFDEATWRRLRRARAAYDPGELFRGNHRIPPAG